MRKLGPAQAGFSLGATQISDTAPARLELVQHSNGETDAAILGRKGRPYSGDGQFDIIALHILREPEIDSEVVQRNDIFDRPAMSASHATGRTEVHEVQDPAARCVHDRHVDQADAMDRDELRAGALGRPHCRSDQAHRVAQSEMKTDAVRLQGK